MRTYIDFFARDDYAKETIQERINSWIERQKEEYGKTIEIISVTYGDGKYTQGRCGMPGLYVAYKEID